MNKLERLVDRAAANQRPRQLRIGLRAEMHVAMRTYCAAHEMTARQVVEVALEQFLAKH